MHRRTFAEVVKAANTPKVSETNQPKTKLALKSITTSKSLILAKGYDDFGGWDPRQVYGNGEY